MAKRVKVNEYELYTRFDGEEPDDDEDEITPTLQNPTGFTKQFTLPDKSTIRLVFADKDNLLTPNDYTNGWFSLTSVNDTKTIEVVSKPKNIKFDICFRSYTHEETFSRKMKLDPDMRDRYEKLARLFNGSFLDAVQLDETYRITQEKYLLVQRNKEHQWRIIDLRNTVAEDVSTEEQETVVVSIVNILPSLFESHTYRSFQSIDDELPPLANEHIGSHQNELANLIRAFGDTSIEITRMKQKIELFSKFYEAMWVAETDFHKNLRFLNPIELNEYMKKLYHILIESELSHKRKSFHMAWIESIIKNKTIIHTDRLFKLGTELNANLTESVPILTTDDVSDTEWLNMYISNIRAAYTSKLGKVIGTALDKIDKSQSADEINHQLQTIKSEFLHKLLPFIDGITQLEHILIGTKIGITMVPGPRAITGLDDIERMKSVLSEIERTFDSKNAIYTEKYDSVTSALGAFSADDFEVDGGTRIRRNKTRKRNKKRNKSKRHKGYSRR